MIYTGCSGSACTCGTVSTSCTRLGRRRRCLQSSVVLSSRTVGHQLSRRALALWKAEGRSSFFRFHEAVNTSWTVVSMVAAAYALFCPSLILSLRLSSSQFHARHSRPEAPSCSPPPARRGCAAQHVTQCLRCGAFVYKTVKHPRKAAAGSVEAQNGRYRRCTSRGPFVF